MRSHFSPRPAILAFCSAVALPMVGLNGASSAPVNGDDTESFGLRVEGITPDGHSRSFRVSTAAGKADGKGRETVNCRLAEGDNTFIIALPRSFSLDHLTFVNQNSAACGRLRISIADQDLPALSAAWVPVHGSISFAHKRFFHVSMMGVNAKFVRVTFSVQPEMTIAKAEVNEGRINTNHTGFNGISIYNFHPTTSGLLSAANAGLFPGSELERSGAFVAMAEAAPIIIPGTF